MVLVFIAILCGILATGCIGTEPPQSFTVNTQASAVAAATDRDAVLRQMLVNSEWVLIGSGGDDYFFRLRSDGVLEDKLDALAQYEISCPEAKWVVKNRMLAVDLIWCERYNFDLTEGGIEFYPTDTPAENDDGNDGLLILRSCACQSPCAGPPVVIPRLSNDPAEKMPGDSREEVGRCMKSYAPCCRPCLTEGQIRSTEMSAV